MRVHAAMTEDWAKAHTVVGEVCVRDIGSGLELLADSVQVPLLDRAALQLYWDCPMSLPAACLHEYKEITTLLTRRREFIASVHSCEAALARRARQTEIARLVTACIGQALGRQPIPDTFDPLQQPSILLHPADNRRPSVVQLLPHLWVAGVVHPVLGIKTKFLSR